MHRPQGNQYGDPRPSLCGCAAFWGLPERPHPPREARITCSLPMRVAKPLLWRLRQQRSRRRAVVQSFPGWGAAASRGARGRLILRGWRAEGTTSGSGGARCEDPAAAVPARHATGRVPIAVFSKVFRQTSWGLVACWTCVCRVLGHLCHQREVCVTPDSSHDSADLQVGNQEEGSVGRGRVKRVTHRHQHHRQPSPQRSQPTSQAIIPTESQPPNHGALAPTSF